MLFFIVGLVGDSARADLLGWAVIRVRGTHAWHWITYELVHEGFWHLLGNGLMLWWTGAIVERERGPRVFVGVLTAGAVVGALVWWLTGVGGRSEGALVGASGAVHALALVALLGRMEDRITVLLFFFLPVNMKVRWLVNGSAVFALAGWAFS
ncbi:MAG: rhomboid family intramembrane serine protease, partial [Verrucomicrobiota bacterium]